MTAEQQLERSVLEGKERDELSAIAQAMSLKTNSRTKKADIIDQILDATGVTSGAAAGSNGDAEHDTNGSKPARRSRASDRRHRRRRGRRVPGARRRPGCRHGSARPGRGRRTGCHDHRRGAQRR